MFFKAQSTGFSEVRMIFGGIFFGKYGVLGEKFRGSPGISGVFRGFQREAQRAECEEGLRI